MKSRTLYHSLLLLLLLCGACTDKSGEFDACGQVEATEVMVSAESNGRIVRLDLTEGDRLRKGMVVGVIDSVQTFLQKQELLRKKANARTKQVDIRRQLASQYERLNNLRVDYERYRILEAKDAGTRKQVEDLASQIAVAEREIAAQKQTYERNNAGIKEEMDLYDVQIAEKEDLLAKCRIVAPIDGVVLTKFAEAGEMATAGKSLFKMADMNQVYVRAYLTTPQLSEVKLGDSLRVTIDDGTKKQRSYTGKLIWIADEMEFTPKNIQTKDERADLVYAVKIALRNDGYLKLGMYAFVHFK
ncbi:MAG: efflux RND transporter periplasmic adaptor subunit [Candidatus Paraprevotella stercoravium]|jgi:HlyD family secretion protein|uniref:Efflux RND transporter periplasmic adaptor subunit n=1 Tax=Candidatus Paraprevotella stercoravium TaxID=2838725 RepID=A0A9E2L586_9BACT|nr:efflux RND transporter periplasmic adaptor subunit [Candidatus Paraprevotella stercoravium]